MRVVQPTRAAASRKRSGNCSMVTSGRGLCGSLEVEGSMELFKRMRKSFVLSLPHFQILQPGRQLVAHLAQHSRGERLSILREEPFDCLRVAPSSTARWMSYTLM